MSGGIVSVFAALVPAELVLVGVVVDVGVDVVVVLELSASLGASPLLQHAQANAPATIKLRRTHGTTRPRYSGCGPPTIAPGRACHSDAATPRKLCVCGRLAVWPQPFDASHGASVTHAGQRWTGRATLVDRPFVRPCSKSRRICLLSSTGSDIAQSRAGTKRLLSAKRIRRSGEARDEARRGLVELHPPAAHGGHTVVTPALRDAAVQHGTRRYAPASNLRGITRRCAPSTRHRWCCLGTPSEVRRGTTGRRREQHQPDRELRRQAECARDREAHDRQHQHLAHEPDDDRLGKRDDALEIVERQCQPEPEHHDAERDRQEHRDDGVAVHLAASVSRGPDHSASSRARRQPDDGSDRVRHPVATWIAAVFGTVSGLAAGPEPAPAVDAVELHWHAPASCPSEADVSARIAARIEPRATSTDRIVADIVITVNTDHVADLVITTSSGRTARRLEATSCETVTEAAVLIVAMVHAQSQPAPVVVEPTEPPALAPTPKPAEAPRAPVPRDRRLRGGVFAEIAVGFAGLPGVGPGLGGGLALLGHRFRAELVGAFWFARDASIGLADADARVDVRMWSVGADAGPVLHAGPVEFALLVGGRAGLAHGEGDGVPIARSARRPWVSLGAYPEVLWPLHPRVAIGARGTVEGVLVRPRFAVREGGTRFTATRVAGALSAVVEVRFP